MQGLIARLSDAGRLRWAGRPLGADTEEIRAEFPALDAAGAAPGLQRLPRRTTLSGSCTRHRCRFFFAHIMKTAGTNFLVQFDRLFPADAIWPQYRPGKETAAEHWDTISDYLSLGSLLALSDEQRRQLAFVAGHLPFVTVELLPDNGDLACLTLLRDPVERTVSFLAQCRKHRPELSDLPLESIYDDPWYFDRFVRDHQTRVLSMTLEEAMAPWTDQQLFTDFLLSLIPTSATATERAHVEELVAEGQPLFSENTGRVVVALEAIGVDMTDTRDRYEAMAGQPQYRVPEGGMGFLYADVALSRPSPVDAARLATAKANLATARGGRHHQRLRRLHRRPQHHVRPPLLGRGMDQRGRAPRRRAASVVPAAHRRRQPARPRAVRRRELWRVGGRAAYLRDRRRVRG